MVKASRFKSYGTDTRSAQFPRPPMPGMTWSPISSSPLSLLRFAAGCRHICTRRCVVMRAASGVATRINDICPCSNETRSRLDYHHKRSWHLYLVLNDAGCLFPPCLAASCHCHLMSIYWKPPNRAQVAGTACQPRFGV